MNRWHYLAEKGPDLAARLILLLFLATGFWYTFWNPLGEGVDEGAHFQYVRYVKEHWSLPVQPFRDNGRSLLVSMGHHPPLYYALGALVISWIDTRDALEVLIPNPHFVWGVDHPRNGWNVYLHTDRERWPWRGTVLAMHVIRGLTLLMGAAALWAVYRTGCLLLPNMPWIAVTGMAWLAFNPSFIFMSSAIHHDALMAAFFSSGLWWLTRLFHRPFTWKEGLVGGFLLGAALLTKFSGLVLALTYGLGFLLLSLPREGRHLALRLAAVTYSVALGVAGWWYLRNWILYRDPLAWEMYKSVFWFNIRSGPFTWDTFVHEFLYQLAQTFWGAFGFMHITLPPAIWWSFWKFAAGLLALALIVMASRPAHFFADGRWRLWLVVLGGLIVLLAAFVRHATETAGGGHARYMFPALTGFVTLLAIGCHALTVFRLQPLVTGLVATGLSLYALVIPQRFVIPLYPRPETAPEELVAAAHPIHICFADAICAQAGVLSPEGGPGAYSLAIYWQTQPGQRPDLFARFRLIGPDGSAVLQDEFWPIPSFSTVAWDPARVYVTRRPVQIPPASPAGTYILELSLTAGRGGPPLPAQDATGKKWEEYAPMLTLRADHPVPFTEEVGVRRSDELEHTIQLLGYSLEKTLYRPGETLRVTLFWQPRQTIQPNLVIFVHLLDAQGNLVAQHDGVPDEGRRPTPFWQPGAVVRDAHSIPIPDALPPGEYTLSVGMYDWPSLQRLRVVEGPASGNDHIFLEVVRIEP